MNNTQQGSRMAVPSVSLRALASCKGGLAPAADSTVDREGSPAPVPGGLPYPLSPAAECLATDPQPNQHGPQPNDVTFTVTDSVVATAIFFFLRSPSLY